MPTVCCEDAQTQATEATRARLFLADGVGQIIRNGLAVMGVEAVSEMN